MAEQDRSAFAKATADKQSEDRQSTTVAQPPPLPARFTRAHRKTRVGEVISDKMNKTIVVQTVTRVPHPRFGKIVKQMRKFYAHDEENKAKTGDTVRIMETRPLSKLKRWRLVEVLQK